MTLFNFRSIVHFQTKMAPNITDVVLKPTIIGSEPLLVKEPLSSQQPKNFENDVNNNKQPVEEKKESRYFEQGLVWRNIIIISYSYYCLVYGFYLLSFTSWPSFIFCRSQLSDKKKVKH